MVEEDAGGGRADAGVDAVLDGLAHQPEPRHADEPDVQMQRVG